MVALESGLALALVAMVAILDADWLMTVDLVAALLLGSVAVAGDGTWRGIDRAATTVRGSRRTTSGS